MSNGLITPVAIVDEVNNEFKPGKEATIIIPLHNQLEMTKQCLQYLSEFTQDVSHDVILIDNASDDGTREYLEKLASVSDKYTAVINEENQGFAPACNQGIVEHMLRGNKHVMLLNNDVMVQPQWLRRMIDLAEKDKNIGIVGAALFFPDKRVQHVGWTWPVLGVPHHPYYGIQPTQEFANEHLSEPHKVEGVTFACALLTESLQATEQPKFTVPFLDEGYRIGGYEDVDYCLQAEELGFDIWLEPVRLIHYEHQSFAKAYKKSPEEERRIRLQAQANLDRLQDKWSVYRIGDNVREPQILRHISKEEL